MVHSFSRRHFIGSTITGIGLSVLPISKLCASLAQNILRKQEWSGEIGNLPTSIQLFSPSQSGEDVVLHSFVAEFRHFAAICDEQNDAGFIAQLNHNKILQNVPDHFFKACQAVIECSELTSGLYFPFVSNEQNSSYSHMRADQILNLNNESNIITLLVPSLSLSFQGIKKGLLISKISRFLEKKGFFDYHIVLGSLTQTRLSGPVLKDLNISHVQADFSVSRAYMSLNEDKMPSSSSLRELDIFSQEEFLNTQQAAIEIKSPIYAEAFIRCCSRMGAGVLSRFLLQAGGGTVYNRPSHNSALQKFQSEIYDLDRSKA